MSRSISVSTLPPYTVEVGPGALGLVADAVQDDQACVVVSDENVAPLYGGQLGLDCPALVVPAGETTKNFGELERLLERFCELRLDRRTVVIALGGGVVGDLAGMAASLYMRGVEVVQAPTSLLAQVDASVGGKTAVNLRAGKNLAGTFHQPRAVFADTSTLTTLSEQEYRSGLGEVLKTALLEGGSLLELLEANRDGIPDRDPALLEEVVASCVRTKASIVAADERESGEREALNLGHTFAHAIEHVAGFGRIPHGVAVGVGLVLALQASQEARLAQEADLVGRTERLLASFGMPTSLAGLRAAYSAQLEPDALRNSLQLDKKARAGSVRFVLVERLGRARTGVALADDLVRKLLS